MSYMIKFLGSRGKDKFFHETINMELNESNYIFSFFPIAAEGETVYSLFCRYFFRSGLPYTNVLKQIIGHRRRASLLSAVPGYLKRILITLPIGNPGRDIKNILYNHTILPYLLYFDGKNKFDFSVNEFATDHPQPLYLKIGLSLYSQAPIIKHPRFCLKCIKEQEADLGFAYFRREHQLPAVAVCYLHGEKLAHGCKHCGPYPITKNAFSMPGRCNCKNITPLFSYKNLPSNKNALEWFAIQSAYIAKSRGSSYSNPKTIIKQKLLEYEVTRNSQVQYNKIVDAIENRFGVEFVRWLGLSLRHKGLPSAWIRRFFDQHSNMRRKPPIQYLLFIGAMFDSIEVFEKGTAQAFLQNGKINQLSIESSKPLLKDKTCVDIPSNELITQLKKIIKEKRIGLASISNHLNIKMYELIAVIKQQGIRIPLTDRFKKRMGNSKISAIRKKLKMGEQKILIQQEFNCSEWSILCIELDRPELNKSYHLASKINIREKHRRNLINFLNINPNAYRSDLMHQMAGTYDYLITKDKEWFHAHMERNPHPKRKQRPKWRIDWIKYDREKCKELKQFLNEVLIEDAKPVRLTKSSLLKKINLLPKYYSDNQRFPNVTKVLNKSIETPIDFQKRRIRWALRNMAKNDIEVSIKKLCRESGLTAEILRKHKKYVISQSLAFKAKIHGLSFFA